MRLFRSTDSETPDTIPMNRSGGRDNLAGPRQQEVADVLAVARCPRCGDVLVANVKRGRLGFWCRCPVRRVLALAVPVPA
jgi:hypothetical protein